MRKKDFRREMRLRPYLWRLSESWDIPCTSMKFLTADSEEGIKTLIRGFPKVWDRNRQPRFLEPGGLVDSAPKFLQYEVWVKCRTLESRIQRFRPLRMNQGESIAQIAVYANMEYCQRGGISNVLSGEVLEEIVINTQPYGLHDTIVVIIKPPKKTKFDNLLVALADC